MEPQTTAPPPSSAAAVVTTTDSVASSPRYRNPDSDDNSKYNASTASPAPAPAKLRLMCSYGGHIVPRPHDKSLCYVGGDTRIVVVDRHVTLPELTKALLRSNSPAQTPATAITIKYQLPSEDLDSLISVTTDEDLENMIDEYDRLNNAGSARLRLFLFPVKPESVTSIGSLLEGSSKSEDWFLNALNGTTSSGFSDTSSVNCLLGLEDDVAVKEKKGSGSGLGLATVTVKSLRSNPTAHDVQSVPDSPMLETTSSFGSASSSPPIRVDDQHVKHLEEVNYVPVVSKVAVSDNSNTNRVGLEEERLEEAVKITIVKPQQQQQQQQVYKQKGSGFDMVSPDSVSSDGSVTNPLSRRKPPVVYQDPSSFNDQSPRIQIQPAQQVDPQHTQLQPQPQPQFIHTAVPPPQYLHHHPSGAVPMTAYYQMYPSQSHQPHIRAPHTQLDQHNFVYYMPARQPPQGYNLPPLQTDPAASAPPSSQVPPPSGLFTAPRAVQTVQTATKTDPPAGMYRTTANSGALPPQLVQVPSSQHPMQPQFVGYSHIQQPSQPVASSGNYVYEFTDPAQQGQHIYYAAQPLPPQSAAQYQTMTASLPVESQADNNMKQQQVRTSQP